MGVVTIPFNGFNPDQICLGGEGTSQWLFQPFPRNWLPPTDGPLPQLWTIGKHGSQALFGSCTGTTLYRGEFGHPWVFNQIKVRPQKDLSGEPLFFLGKISRGPRGLGVFMAPAAYVRFPVVPVPLLFPPG